MSEEQTPRPLHRSTSRYIMHNWQLRPHEAVPLNVARKVAELVTEACMVVCNPTHVFLGDPDAPAMSDDVVAEVMHGLQAQLDKEGESRTRGSVCSRHGVKHTTYYRLAQDVPMARQRALAERIWRLWKEWGGTVQVYAEGDPEPEKPEPPTASPYEFGWTDFGIYG